MSEVKEAAENVVTWDDPETETADMLVNVPKAVVGKLDGAVLDMIVGGDIEVVGIDGVVVEVIEVTVVVIDKMGAPLIFELAFFFGFLGVSVGCMTIIWVVPGGVVTAWDAADAPAAAEAATADDGVMGGETSVLTELATRMEDGAIGAVDVGVPGTLIVVEAAGPVEEDDVVALLLGLPPIPRGTPPILTDALPLVTGIPAAALDTMLGTQATLPGTPAKLAGTPPARFAGTPARVAGTPLFVKTMLKPPPGVCCTIVGTPEDAKDCGKPDAKMICCGCCCESVGG